MVKKQKRGSSAGRTLPSQVTTYACDGTRAIMRQRFHRDISAQPDEVTLFAREIIERKTAKPLERR